MKRRVGRPRKAVVTRASVLRATLALLERQGIDAVTMRGLAKRLGVDPMALYHYFDDRHALLAAAAELVFESLDVPSASGWRARLEALALAYVGLIARWSDLIRYLTAHGESVAEPIAVFDAKFAEALGSLKVKPAAKPAFVDLLHGFALGVPRSGLTTRMRTQLAAELDIILDGIRR